MHFTRSKVLHCVKQASVDLAQCPQIEMQGVILALLFWDF